MNTFSRLDADELMHLALAASQRGQAGEAIDFLKRLLEISPQNAEAHHILGAEYAQIGMYDRAVEEMTQAVAIDPGLDTLRFQLGLLHLTMRRVDEATEVWSGLDHLDHDHPYYLFKTGLIHLAKDEFAACTACLEKGIAANKFNEPLNNDMRRVLDEIAAQTDADAVADKQTEGQEEPAPHLFLSAYTTGKAKV